MKEIKTYKKAITEDIKKDIVDILQEKNDFTEEEFELLLKNHEFQDKGSGADTQITESYGDTLSLNPVKKEYATDVSTTDSTEESFEKGITSKTDINKLLDEAADELKTRRAATPTAIESIGGVVYYDSPFVAQQAKKLPHTTRIRQKVVKVFDLSITEQVSEFNDLLNKYIYDFSNIGNLNYQLQTFEAANTWKALVMYDILEFKNPFHK